MSQTYKGVVPMENEDLKKAHDHHEGCCGHDHDHQEGHCCHDDHGEEEYAIIHLTLDNDEEMDCIVFGTFDFEDKSYIALVPYEEDNQDLLLYIYEELENGDLDLQMIPEEDFDRVADEFDRQFPEE